MKKYGILIILLLLSVMTGCSRKMMALNQGQDVIDTSGKSIALLSVTMTNEYKPSFQPKVYSVNIGPESEKTSAGTAHFTKNAYVKQNDDEKAEYYLSFELTPGSNILKEIHGGFNNLLIIGACNAKNLNLATTLKPGTVAYLGHVSATINERKSGDEDRAGPLLPLLDQALTGFHGGTFNIKVEDRYEEDMEIFLSQYPGLKNVKIEKSILPQWVKPGSRASN